MLELQLKYGIQLSQDVRASGSGANSDLLEGGANAIAALIDLIIVGFVSGL